MKKLPTLLLECKVHKSQNQLCVRFEYNREFINLLRTIQGVRWSRSLQSWYVRYHPETLSQIRQLFSNIASIENRVSIQKKEAKQLTSHNHQLLLSRFQKYLEGKRYSKNTCATYSYLLKEFLIFYSEKSIDELDNRSVERYIEAVFLPRNYSISTQRQLISALKLFVVFYPKTKMASLELSRPKKSKTLPTILSKEEVLRIIQVTKNLKHRVVIALLYSSGLRIGELVQLKLEQIDVERFQIKIVQGKGRKDRFVGLAQSFIPLLRNYLNTYQPSEYFVEGIHGGKYTESSIRKFLARSVQLAGIKKKVTAHTFRHSYATHLLENGVALRHIQELLGHAKPETTMIYTHVTRKSLLDVQSPLDTILLSLGEKNKEDTTFRLTDRDRWI